MIYRTLMDTRIKKLGTTTKLSAHYQIITKINRDTSPKMSPIYLF